MSFTADYQNILSQIESIDPIRYGKTRNYLNGAVTRLSPYISRGLISTRQIAQSVLSKGYKPFEIESFLKELAWRDYYQQVWIDLGDDINKDIKQPQPNCENTGLCEALISGNTGIEAIDRGITELMNSGYMHNHMRMYTASIACNIGKYHWQMPAKWMYYYLLDADWASNALSWQWVAGSFSSKKYFANQENINKYCQTNQFKSFLDVPYEHFESMITPEVLKRTSAFELKTTLPAKVEPGINQNLPTYIYNFYNLDCTWHSDAEANRILLLEPSFYEKYPVSEKTIAFIIDLSHNIPGIQIFTGEFNELKTFTGQSEIYFKEHPTAGHYKGIKHSREFMFKEVQGYFPSFFAYWKKCERHISSNLNF